MDEKIGVLLMAYGAAGSLDEIEPYLYDIRGGRPTSPQLVEVVKHRYQLMGGRSPLLEITMQQAAALEKRLNQGQTRFKTYIGMRHWHPYIKDSVAVMAADGIREMVALCLTPYYSNLSVGAYYQKLDEAVSALSGATGGRFNIRRIESWNDHPRLIEAIAEKIGRALERFPADIREKVPVLFSAHSLPERILAEKDPYPQELHETIGLVMKKIGPYAWRFAYQSKGRTPEPWLGPDAADVINELHAQGHRHLLMAPIGFISDHMETLYDVDVMYREQCRSKGIQLERAESLNASPAFIETLAAVVLENL
ncbi:MAG TPA: ferrochelatase [Nitrospiria bacterium]|jgi:ferrochelatase|nr:ferrochelatase [Nitrospiria bacterium]